MDAFIPPLHWLKTEGASLLGQSARDVEREFVRITGGSGLVSGVTAVGRGNCDAPHLPTGVKFQGSAHDYTVRLADMSNFRMRYVPGRYTNGDGFATELTNPSISFNTCRGVRCSDAGFDLKGPGWHLHNCLAEGCAHNYRLWSGGRATGRLISQSPVLPDPSTPGAPIHIHVCTAVEHTQQQEITIDFLYARGPGTLLRVETKTGAIPPRIVIRDHDVRGVTRVLHVSGEAPEVIWGRGEPRAG